MNGQEVVALKRLHGTFAPSRISKEIEILKKLQGRHYVVPLKEGFRHEDNITLVFPYFHHKPFREYYLLMEEAEIREYMRVSEANALH